MVFQDYALYPHMTIADNIAYPLEGARRAAGEAPRPRPGGGGRAADRRPARPPAEPDLRRPAAAHLARPGAGLPEPGLSLRRAALQPRRQDAARGARLPQPPAARHGHDRGLRHPRPGRGHGARHPRRGDGQGPDRAVRAADRDLPPPGHHLRRQLRRQPADEPPARRGDDRVRPALHPRRGAAHPGAAGAEGGGHARGQGSRSASGPSISRSARPVPTPSPARSSPTRTWGRRSS